MSAIDQRQENKMWRVIRTTSVALVSLLMIAGIAAQSAHAQVQPGQTAKPPAQTAPPPAAAKPAAIHRRKANAGAACRANARAQSQP